MRRTRPLISVPLPNLGRPVYLFVTNEHALELTSRIRNLRIPFTSVQHLALLGPVLRVTFPSQHSCHSVRPACRLSG